MKSWKPSLRTMSAITASFLIALPAHASTVVSEACISVANTAGCKFSGNINGNTDPLIDHSFKNAEAAYNLFNNTHPTANPDISLNFLGDTNAGFPGTFTGAGTTSGTWNLSGYLVDFFSVKAGNDFILYKLAVPTSAGSWSTAGLTNRQGQRQDLSHLSFFGTQSAVPEPATWAMMMLGFGLIGGAMRRRSFRLNYGV
jgi:PEP-CTERM motif